MDKETLSHYGWVVILVLILSVMLALATPFGTFVADGIKSTTAGFFSVNQNAMGAIGTSIGDLVFDTCEHEYEPDVTVDCNTTGMITYTCKNCDKKYTEFRETAKHTFDNADDTTCNDCNISFINYEFRAWDFDSKTGSTTQTDAHVVIPETFVVGSWGYKVTSIGNNAFKDCTNLTTCVVPETVTRIGEYAFSGCTSLRSINIPEGITSIETRTFWNCETLDGVILPSTLKIVGYESFSGCKSLQSIIIPEGVTEITCERAFSNCTSLKSAYVPSTLVGPVCGNTFSGCSSLADIKFGGTVEQLRMMSFYHCTYFGGTGATEIVCSNGSITLE